MGHAYKDTLLSKCGFADDDRADSNHDLACEYISENFIDLLGAIDAEKNIDQRECLFPTQYYNGDICNAVYCGKGVHLTTYSGIRQEYTITKGAGQYKHLIGFADVVAEITHRIHIRGGVVRSNGENRLYLQNTQEFYKSCKREDQFTGVVYKTEYILIIEVKATRTPVSDITRQLGLYNTFIADIFNKPTAQMLVACYPLKETEKAQLLKNGIRPIQLGDKFEQWKAVRSSENRKTVSIEL